MVLAGLRDGRKVILAVESGHRESTESWRTVLPDLQRRGLRAPRVVVGDGHLGYGARCPPPFRRPPSSGAGITSSLLDKLPTRLQAEAKSLLTPIPCAERQKAGAPHLGDEERRRRRGPRPWTTTGPVGDVLAVPEGALEAPADDEPDPAARRARAAGRGRGRRDARQRGAREAKPGRR